MKKRILAAVVAAAAVLSLAGCKDDTTSSTPNDNSNPGANNSTPTGDASVATGDLTDEDNTLSIGIWSDNGDYNNLINFFKEQTGTSVEVVPVSGGKAGGDARDGYQNLMKDDSVDLDLIICDTDWVRNYVSTDEWCAPLSDLGITKDDYKDAYGYTLTVGTGDDGVFRGATFQATPGCFFYNAGVAKEYLNVETPEAMQEKVKDWDSFKATAKELNEKSGGKVALTATEGGLWQVYQCMRTKAWVVDGKLEMDTATDFYDIAKDLYDNGGISKSAVMWQDSWYTTMQAGEALGEFAPTWGLTGLTGSILGDCAGEDNRGDNAIFSAIAGPTDWYWGGSYFCVTKKCNTKKTAAEFVKFYTCNADTMKGYTEKTGDFMNNKSVMNSTSYANPSLIGGQNHITVISAGAEKINLDGKLTTYDSRIKELFNESVDKYLKGDIATKDEAIESFKKEVRNAYPDLTVE